MLGFGWLYIASALLGFGLCSASAMAMLGCGFG